MQFLLQLRRNARVLGAVRQIFVLICSEIVRLVTLVVIPAPQGGFMRANKTEQWA